MKSRASGLRAAGCALLLALVVLGSGCADESGFIIEQNQVPDDNCQVQSIAALGGIFRSSGLLDVTLGRGYVLYPLVRSALLSSQLTDQTRPETNSFQLRSFIVKLDMSDIVGSFESKLTSFSVPTSGVVAPGTSRATAVKIVPDQLVQQLNLPAQARPTIVATVQAVAVRLGSSSEIESPEFIFPIELCTGCLVKNVSPCPTDPATKPDEVPAYQTNACGLPQDQPLACCGLGSGNVECLTQ